jgi:hypothetical protein
MIIIARNYGQLGNRLFLYAHLIAAAEEYGIELANPCFAEYAHLFPATAADLWCRYPAKSSHTQPSLRRRQVLAKAIYLSTKTLATLGLTRYPVPIKRLKGEQTCDLASHEFAEAVRHRHLLVQGWLFRSNPLAHKHLEVIRRHFQIQLENQARVDHLIAQLRSKADIIVGVHIRHGDYVNFMGGRYFFSVQQYVAAMRNIADQFPHQKVAFLVCSNAKLDPGVFGELNVRLGLGHISEDLYSFAAADLLIGPPSTYTGWASFYGDVPLVQMKTADLPIDLSVMQTRQAA